MNPSAPPTTGQDYLTPDEAIALLRLKGRQQFYRLVREGYLPVVHLGPRVTRVPRKSLDSYLKATAAPMPHHI